MLKKVLWISAALVCCLVIAAVLYPMFDQPKHGRVRSIIVDGVVLDGAGRPIPGVKLSVVGYGAKPLGTFTTDAKGEFHVPRELEAGRILGFVRSGIRRPVINHHVVSIFRWDRGALYDPPDKAVPLDRIKNLRFGILLDEEEAYLPNQRETAKGDENATAPIATDQIGQFKFPAA